MNPLYEQMQTSVFERMSMLAIQHRAVNLGQGFPDFGWPEPILHGRAGRWSKSRTNIRRRAACRSCAKRSPAITAATSGRSSRPTRYA